ncbi:hypothetical protein B0H10DRAFT_1941714 [Mycena sp. CBHHK59/15]|nr:hypothetical protein B0H10DRAFT_1941714 [Mycena sp. CBHHK59/15]
MAAVTAIRWVLPDLSDCTYFCIQNDQGKDVTQSTLLLCPPSALLATIWTQIKGFLTLNKPKGERVLTQNLPPSQVSHLHSGQIWHFTNGSDFFNPSTGVSRQAVPVEHPLPLQQQVEALTQSLSPEQIEPRVFVRVGTEHSAAEMIELEIKVSEFESFGMNLGMNTDIFSYIKASSQWGSDNKKKDSKAVPADDEPGNVGPDTMGMEEVPDMGERGKGGATEDACEATKDACRDTTEDMSKHATEDAFTC